MKTDPVSVATGYRMVLEKIMHAKTLHEAQRLSSRALGITFDAPSEGHLSVSSGFGYDSQQPYVAISIANPEETANPTVQLRTSQAREIALGILASADAAESDGFVTGWLGGMAEMSERQAAGLLADFRAYRDKLRGEASGE